MYMISFVRFKQCCKFFDHDFDFSKDVCSHEGHDVAQHVATVPDGPDKGRRHTYHRCCAKHCPALVGCRRPNKEGQHRE